MALQHLLLLSEKTMNADDVALFSKTIAHSKHITTTVRDEIIDRTLQLENLTPSLKESLPPKAQQIADECFKAAELKDWKSAIKLAESIEQEDGLKENLLGRIYFVKKEYQTAEKYLLLSNKKGEKAALLGLALVYERQNQIFKAEEYYLESIVNDNEYGLLGLSLLYYNRGIKKDKALQHISLFNQKNTANRQIELQILIKIWNGIIFFRRK
jgi:tetratricopeptide (TPR) repeat protein